MVMDGDVVFIPFEEVNIEEGEDLGFEDDFGGVVRSVSKEVERFGKKMGVADQVIDEIEKVGLNLWRWRSGRSWDMRVLRNMWRMRRWVLIWSGMMMKRPG